MVILWKDAVLLWEWMETIGRRGGGALRVVLERWNGWENAFDAGVLRPNQGNNINEFLIEVCLGTAALPQPLAILCAIPSNMQSMPKILFTLGMGVG